MIPQIQHVTATVITVAITEHGTRGVDLSAAAALYARENWPALATPITQSDEEAGDR